MKNGFFVILAIATVTFTVVAGCRGGQCGNCGYNAQGYQGQYGQQYGQPPAQPTYGQPSYAPGTFIQQGQQLPGNFAQPQGGFAQPPNGFQPGVVPPNQLAPAPGAVGSQFQGGNQFGSGGR